MINIAVILAAGSGKRAGGGLPKQFRRLADGRTVLETCVAAFEACGAIDEILIVTHPDYIVPVQQQILSSGWQKVSGVVAGGAERWESSWNAIQSLAVDEEQTNILLHDCARPFVSVRILDDVCRALEQSAAVTVAVPVTDTLYRVAENRLVDVPSRTDYLRAQTPQAFRLRVIREAYARFMADTDHTATDDIGVLRRYRPDVVIQIVEGEEANRKLTFAADFQQE